MDNDKEREEFESLLKQFRLREMRPLTIREPARLPGNRMRKAVWASVAAAFAMLATIGYFRTFVFTPDAEAPAVDVTAATGEEAVEPRAVVRYPDADKLILEDGSQVETERGSASSLELVPGGVRVKLGAGRVIVSTPDAGAALLEVQSKDLLVGVRGTALVEASASGTRVGVIQGEADLQQGSALKKLRAGEQSASASLVQLTPLAEAVGWSRQSKDYAGLLAQAVAPGSLEGVTPGRIAPINVAPIQVAPIAVSQPSAPSGSPGSLPSPVSRSQQEPPRKKKGEPRGEQPATPGAQPATHGAAIVQQACGTCHPTSVAYRHGASSRKQVEDWIRFEKSRGAPIEEDQIGPLVDALLLK